MLLLDFTFVFCVGPKLTILQCIHCTLIELVAKMFISFFATNLQCTCVVILAVYRYAINVQCVNNDNYDIIYIYSAKIRCG